MADRVAWRSDQNWSIKYLPRMYGVPYYYFRTHEVQSVEQKEHTTTAATIKMTREEAPTWSFIEIPKFPRISVDKANQGCANLQFSGGVPELNQGCAPVKSRASSETTDPTRHQIWPGPPKMWTPCHLSLSLSFLPSLSPSGVWSKGSNVDIYTVVSWYPLGFGSGTPHRYPKTC